MVEQAIASGAGMGVINLAEVMGRLVRDGISVDTARATLLELPVTLFDVDADLALVRDRCSLSSDRSACLSGIGSALRLPYASVCQP